MKNLTTIAIIFLIVQCEPVIPQKSTVEKVLIFDNHEYEDLVGNVDIDPVLNQNINNLANPIINLRDDSQLFLSFDL